MCPHLIERFEPRLCLSVTLTAAHAMGSVAGDSITAIVESGGNRIVGGIFKKTLPLGTRTRPFAISSSGGIDGFVASYTADGKLNWAFALGGPGNDRVAGLAADPDGGFAVTGDFEGRTDFDPGPASTRLKSSGGTDIFVARYSAKGELRFAGQMGGSRNDHGAAVKFDPGGALLTSGTFGGRADFDPSRNFAWLDVVLDGRIFVTKLSPQGKFQWVHSSDETFHFGNDVGRALATDAAANAYVAGDVTTRWNLKNFKSNELHNGYLAKYGPDGTPAWNKTFLGAGSDAITALAADPAGNTYVTGVMRERLYADQTLLKSSGDTDGFVIKLDPAGNVVWATQIGGAGADRGEAIAIAADGNILCAGSFSGAADFHPGRATSILRSAGQSDAYLAVFTPTGDLVSADRLGGAGPDYAVALAVPTKPPANPPAVLWGGRFSARVPLVVAGAPLRWTAAGSDDAFWVEAAVG